MDSDQQETGEARTQRMRELLVEILNATGSYKDAQKQTSYARMTECTCLNALNLLQKEFDKLMEEQKALNEGDDSDWGIQQRKRRVE